MDFSSTLADTLLDDLDDLSDVEDKEETETNSEIDRDENCDSIQHDCDGVHRDGKGIINHRDDIVVSSSSSSSAAAATIESNSSTSQSKRSQFIDDPKLQLHLSAIESTKASPQYDKDNEQEGGYSLMTTSNKYLQSIQNVINQAHTDLTLAYKTKFPELEDLLPDPISYKNAIKVIQNEMDLTVINEELNSIANLTSNQIITLSVASSTTSGQPLSQKELDHVNQCISYIENVLDIKAKLIAHVEQHMDYLAPNMVILLGPTLAARMVSAAGGLSELSRIPACNLQVVGQKKASSASRAGFGTSIAASSAVSAASSGNILKPHQGILAECDLCRLVPSHLQRKALKLLAAKVALAIRCDFVNLESGRERTKTTGLKLLHEIKEKFVKWEEPDKAPVVKALPK